MINNQPQKIPARIGNNAPEKIKRTGKIPLKYLTRRVKKDSSMNLLDEKFYCQNANCGKIEERKNAVIGDYELLFCSIECAEYAAKRVRIYD